MSQIALRVLRKNRDECEATLAQLRLLAAYEQQPSPSGNHPNLLKFLQTGDPQHAANSGTRLASKIAAVEAQLVVIDELVLPLERDEDERIEALNNDPIQLAADPTDA